MRNRRKEKFDSKTKSFACAVYKSTVQWGVSGSELENLCGQLTVTVINCIIYLMFSQHILTLLDPVSAD